MAVKNITDLHVRGDVGIGTTSPSYKLDVAGEGRFTSYLNVDATVGIRSSGWVHLHRYGSSTNVAVGQSGTNVSLLVNNGNIETQGSVKLKNVLLFDQDGDFTGGNYYTMEDHSGGYFRMGYAFNSDLVISTSGNVGIGTTSPSEKLEVKSGRADVLLESTTAGQATRYRLKTTSREWRIGTNSPKSDAFWIYDTDAGSYRLEISTSGNLKLPAYGAGLLQTDANGNVSLDTNTYLTAEADTLDSVTDRGNSTTNAITTGSVTATSSSYVRMRVDQTDSALIDMGISSGGAEGFLNVQNTGSNHSTDDPELKLLLNTTEYARLNSTGLGIGTTSPDRKLHVNSGTTNHVAIFESTDATAWIQIKDNATASYVSNTDNGLTIAADTNNEGADSNIRLLIDGSERMRITATGNVGIGTTSPAEKLSVAGNIALVSNDSFISFNTSASSGDPKIQMGSDGDFSFQNTAGSTNLHIENGGNVGIGTNNPSYKLHVVGETYLDGRRNFGGGTQTWYWAASGGKVNIDSRNFSISGDTGAQLHKWNRNTADTAYLPYYENWYDGNSYHSIGVENNIWQLSDGLTVDGDITAFSDARIKENVETLPNALESVKSMRGVTYNKIGEEKQSIGVIAQEVQAVLPQLVSEHNDGMLSVAYGNVTAVLIEAIKEQQKQIEELKAQLDGLAK